MMTEPHSTVLGGALVGAGASSVTMFMGAQVDALVLGLVAATFVSIWMETIDNRIKAAAAVMFAAMLAGYGSPVAAEWVASTAPKLSANTEALRLLLAVLIGAVTPSMVPLGLRYMGNKVSGGMQP